MTTMKADAFQSPLFLRPRRLLTSPLSSNKNPPPLQFIKFSKTSLLFLNRQSTFPHFRKNPSSSKVIRVVNSTLHGGMRIYEGEGEDEFDSPVELCYTRTLPPGLTLEHGFHKIKEAVQSFKLNPPSPTSGIVRFQVAVPPCANGLSWFCSHSQSLEVFPKFYLSKEKLDHPLLNSPSFDKLSGVSGIGAAVYFTGSSSASEGWGLIKRYLSVDSPLIRAYGFVGIKFEVESSSIKHETDSLYLFIPQIELDEHEGISLLAATLAWNDLRFCAFSDAVHSFDLSLNQAIFSFSSSEENFHKTFITSILGKSNLMEDGNFQMVSVNANSFDGEDMRAVHLQLEEASTLVHFCFRISPTISLTCNMLDHSSGASHIVQHSANINAVWASLIIEECLRLGLRYFCIAPGSRSSPLAVAASTHPYATCISCFDERSLAFHAVGYARGSCRPAVVITSSGTAVSNLLPAVVEASQDFVPILLLTADRPPELQDAGANQAINQVNHFGSYVRFFFSLPPPTDIVPARMVLTTVDSAVYCAKNEPCGPVHINCAFREPLEDTPREWMSSCLKGLEFWMSGAGPFTKYIRMRHSYVGDSTYNQFDEVLKLIQCARKGILLIGAIHTENEIWAALFLVRHLSWPTFADILSGLRFKKVLTMFPEIKEKFLFVDHLDHTLISDSVREWAHADVIIQVGSRITSKRIGQMLEMCSPCSYILVEKHPYRHDPSHIVTHRIQSTIAEFTSSILQHQFPKTSSKWSEFWQAINLMVGWEINFQILSEISLTEPYVAKVISEALPSNAALFVGNSMVIRDADMYGHGWVNSSINAMTSMSILGVQCLGVRVAGNRGASGIDGLLSTAVGFAVGCNKKVFCLIGDISFLHDTNALAILKQRTGRKPMTIFIINNHGGAIFSLLPVAERTKPSILNQYFYTSHDISIGKLCAAHSVKHVQVRTKLELHRALSISREADTDCIIEVESCIEENACFHSVLRQSSCEAADHTLALLARLSVPVHTSNDLLLSKIHKVNYSQYRFQLSAQPTSTCTSGECSEFYREGFILALYLEDGTVGYGEVAPLDIHVNDLEDVEQQLRFLLYIMQGAKISSLVSLLRGSFSLWISSCLGIPPHSIFPSVRCGMEMAILNALAARQGSSLTDLLVHNEYSKSPAQLLKEKERNKGSAVQICALLDCDGTPQEVADVAAKLVKEGFMAIKIKVGRRLNPSEDADVIQEVRKKIGYKINLRADANRKWTYEQAFQFGCSAKFCELQYIEEPVNMEDDIIKFCEETGLPVALDETIDDIQEDPVVRLEKFIHPGIVAVVIKPSVVGGFENAALIAKWAHKKEKMAVVSAAYESSLSLSTYIQFSYYLNQQSLEICRLKNKELREPVAHGLGTYRWLKQDVTTESLRICGHPLNTTVEAFTEDAAQLLRNLKIDPKIIRKSYTEEQVLEYHLTVDYAEFSCSVKVLEAGPKIDSTVVVFLHGFLGTGQDWIPIMKAVSTSVRCISLDLPGHGESWIQSHDDQEPKRESDISIEVIANILYKVLSNFTASKVVLVGYSMGARIALYMALRCQDQVSGAILISGSPGIKDIRARKTRMVQDDARAQSLEANGLPFFLDTWYSSDLWTSLRNHPHFEQIKSSRMQHNDVHTLAKVLADLSVGKQPSLWEDLKQCKKPLLFLHGAKDKKFQKINQQIHHELGKEDLIKEILEVVEISDAGHAVHLENPLLVISAVRKFLTKLNEKLS